MRPFSCPSPPRVTIPAMRHRLFTLAAGVSAGLCVGGCALSVRSYYRSDDFAFAACPTVYQIASSNGGVCYTAGQVHGVFPADVPSPTALQQLRQFGSGRQWSGKTAGVGG